MVKNRASSEEIRRREEEYKLTQAIQRNDVKKVIKLIQSVHGQDDYVLQWAASTDLNMVKFLVERGANIHSYQDGVLRQAARSGHLDIVKFSIEHEADIHTNDDWPLKWAARNGHLDVVKFLVEHGADIHADDDLALQWAAENGHLDVVEHLIKHGANPITRENQVIKMAAKNGHSEIVAFLFQDPRIRDAGLPFPDPTSKDPLTRILGEILMTSIYTTHEIVNTHFKKNPHLAEHQLLSYIFKYHPISKRK